MIGIALDVLGLFIVTSILARRNMSELMFNMILFALGLTGLGVLMLFAQVHLTLVYVIYFSTLFLGMRFVIGASWLGALVGSVGFIIYKILVELAIGALFGF